MMMNKLNVNMQRDICYHNMNSISDDKMIIINNINNAEYIVKSNTSINSFIISHSQYRGLLR